MFKQFDIILTPFPFTDLSQTKVRPAMILSAHNLVNDDIIVVFISSQKSKQKYPADIFLKKDLENNLKTDSILKIAKIATLDKKIILGELGNLNKKDQKKVQQKLQKIFGL